jgi:hypothetical protein
MSKPGLVALVFGFVVAATVASDSLALTPEEQAALREEARRLMEQARAQHAQADLQRVLALQIFVAEFKKADGVEDQADFKMVTALQKWLQAGAVKEARASGLWESGRSLLWVAYQAEVVAALLDEQAKSERDRAQWQRDQAEALLAGAPDAEAIAVAEELLRLADKDDREGMGYENDADRSRDQADRKNQRAAALLERALELEMGPTP